MVSAIRIATARPVPGCHYFALAANARLAILPTVGYRFLRGIVFPPIDDAGLR